MRVSAPFDFDTELVGVLLFIYFIFFATRRGGSRVFTADNNSCRRSAGSMPPRSAQVSARTN